MRRRASASKPRELGELRARVLSWAQRLRVAPSQVRVQVMTQKWGSCSPRGRITLAKALLDEPALFQDYVIVHELLHLRVRNHGRLFRSYLAAHVPKGKRYENRLKCRVSEHRAAQRQSA